MTQDNVSSKAIDYIHKKSRRSLNLKIQINSKGEVIVITPPLIPKFVIDKYVESHREWITTNLAKMQTRQPKLLFNTKEEVSIFGKTYKKKVEFSAKLKSGIHIIGNELIFNPTFDPNREPDKASQLAKHFENKLQEFLKNTAQHYIINQTAKKAKLMDQNYNKVTLKAQKTRWGSCSSQKNLNFNWKLVHFKPEIIDYVIVHELSHLVHMDHSAKFWALVAKFHPKYQENVNWLKRNGLGVG